MPSFLKDISSFYGNREKNQEGQTLEEFLETYDPYKYKNPSVTTDAVVFSCEGIYKNSLDKLKVLLIKRGNHPSIGFWALPGGFINLEENLKDTAARELREETGVESLPMEQFAVYGDYDRDPRARIITAAYMALIDEDAVNVNAGDDAADAAWCQVEMEQSGQQVVRGYTEKTYVLSFVNEEKGVRTKAEVVHKTRGSLIKEESFKVADGGEIAVDHAAIIAQAVLILKERLEG